MRWGHQIPGKKKPSRLLSKFLSQNGENREAVSKGKEDATGKGMSVLKDLSNPFDYRHLSWLDTLVFLLDEFYTRLDLFVWALHKMLQRVKIKKYPSLCTYNFHSKFVFLDRWPPPQKKTAILTPITNLTCTKVNQRYNFKDYKKTDQKLMWTFALQSPFEETNMVVRVLQKIIFLFLFLLKSTTIVDECVLLGPNKSSLSHARLSSKMQRRPSGFI